MNYKTIVAPIIAVLALAIKGLLGIEVPDDVVSQITDWISTGVLIAVTVYGIFKSHKKKEDDK